MKIRLKHILPAQKTTRPISTKNSGVVLRDNREVLRAVATTFENIPSAISNPLQADYPFRSNWFTKRRDTPTPIVPRNDR